jgi:hypothetical protein
MGALVAVALVVGALDGAISVDPMTLVELGRDGAGR